MGASCFPCRNSHPNPIWWLWVGGRIESATNPGNYYYYTLRKVINRRGRKFVVFKSSRIWGTCKNWMSHFSHKSLWQCYIFSFTFYNCHWIRGWYILIPCPIHGYSGPYVFYCFLFYYTAVTRYRSTHIDDDRMIIITVPNRNRLTFQWNQRSGLLLKEELQGFAVTFNFSPLKYFIDGIYRHSLLSQRTTIHSTFYFALPGKASSCRGWIVKACYDVVETLFVLPIITFDARYPLDLHVISISHPPHSSLPSPAPFNRIHPHHSPIISPHRVISA